MSSSPPDRCNYTWPEDHEIEDDPNHQSCCWRETVSDEYNQCVWHIDSDDFTKTVEKLKTAREPSEIRSQNSPYDELLDGANLSGVELTDTNFFKNVALRDSDFSHANLSDSIFWYSNLSDAALNQTDLSGADFWDANLSDAILEDANLTDAEFRDTNLQGANLLFADLSGAYLGGADLSGAYLQETKNIKSTSVNGATTCRQLDEGYGDDGTTSLTGSISLWIRRKHRGSDFDSERWDATARAYHDLKIVFNDHGLVGKARDMHIQERRARRFETKAADGWSNWRYMGSYISGVFVGYGVQVRNLVLWMLFLFLVSTAVYVYVGIEDAFVKNISYSVLAYTVAPPKIPVGVVTQLIMMLETFLGTLSIVLLGYILGNREQF